MPFNRKPQKFNAAIKSVVIGSGDKTVTLGGENVLPFYAFDGEIKNGPKVGVEITDLGSSSDVMEKSSFLLINWENFPVDSIMNLCVC